MRNAITASKNANCVDLTGCNSIIPLFRTSKKNKTPHSENTEQTTASENDSLDNSPELNFMCGHLDKEHSEFTANVLFYIAGYIVTQLIDKLPCPSCKMSLISAPDGANSSCQHDCTSSRYHEVGKASAFTLFVNKGGLKIPSTSVFHAIEYCEHVFKAIVCGTDSKQITKETSLKNKMIVEVCCHLMLDTTIDLFVDHEDGDNEILVEDDHKMKLMKCTVDKYFTLRLFTFGKKYNKEIVNGGKQSDHHKLNKLILFNNE